MGAVAEPLEPRGPRERRARGPLDDDHGVVDIRSGETHHRFDVYDASTDLEMVGVPGQRGWEVRFKRRALPPVVVTAAMVDAEAFSRELRRWRPGL